MLLAIDIGNTNISSAIFRGKKLIKQFEIPTKTYSKVKFVKKIGLNLHITDTVICSVVPKLTKRLKLDLKLLTGRKPYIIGKDLIVPIKNLYHKPKQLGQDRLVNAYAACNFYNAPLIIIDAGTAITIDTISKKREFLGGIIFPGMNILLNSLKKNTSLLPQIKFQKPGKLIGTDTQNCILSGVVFGMSLMAQELANKIKRQIGKNAIVIGTGGNICLIKKYSKTKIKIEKDLTLKGISLLYENKI